MEVVTLGPADAGAALQHRAIDAWAIWDPHYTLFEKRPGVPTLMTNAGIGEQHSLFMAPKAFVQANPAIAAKALEAFATACSWVCGYRDEVSDALSASTGMPLDAMRRVIACLPAEMLPMTDDIIRSQQEVAVRFRALGLLPIDIIVAGSVWHPNA